MDKEKHSTHTGSFLKPLPSFRTLDNFWEKHLMQLQ